MKASLSPYNFMLFTFLCVLFSAAHTKAACQEKAPELKAALDPVFTTLLNSQEPARWSKFCRLLKDQSEEKTLKKWESSGDEVQGFSKFLDYQTVEFKKEYQRKVAQIELQSSTAVRIEMAYALAMSMYGYAQFVGKEAQIEILRQMANRNARGTDAQRAAFVAWTIQKLLPKQPLRVRVIVAHPTKSLIPEIWVQLYDNKKKIDLDPQASGADFIPLPPRFEKRGISADVLNKECATTMSCLLKEVKS